jgi:RHS repeat-associated protein
MAYTGQVQDGETGLYYCNARYYDPAQGRFLSVDPMGFAAGDTNLYRYVGNDAIGKTDPSGLLTPDVAATAITSAMEWLGLPSPSEIIEDPAYAGLFAKTAAREFTAEVQTVLPWMKKHPMTAWGYSMQSAGAIMKGDRQSVIDIGNVLQQNAQSEYSPLGKGTNEITQFWLELAQGGANVANGTIDALTYIANIPANIENGLARLAGLGNVVPTIPTFDWSKDLFTSEAGTHEASKVIGGNAVVFLGTMGIGSFLPAGTSAGQAFNTANMTIVYGGGADAVLNGAADMKESGCKQGKLKFAIGSTVTLLTALLHVKVVGGGVRQPLGPDYSKPLQELEAGFKSGKYVDPRVTKLATEGSQIKWNEGIIGKKLEMGYAGGEAVLGRGRAGGPDFEIRIMKDLPTLDAMQTGPTRWAKVETVLEKLEVKFSEATYDGVILDVSNMRSIPGAIPDIEKAGAALANKHGKVLFLLK